MGITNYRIDKVDAQVEKRNVENVDVKESFGITNVETTKSNQMLEVSWSFDIDYKAMGKISMAGKLVYFSDNIADKTEEKTVKGKKILTLKGVALKDVSNFVLRRGIVEAIIVSKTLQLPAPIQLPSVRVGPRVPKE
jgi:hypothetical protein